MSSTGTAVLFDVDGTRVDRDYLHALCWWDAFTQAGHDVPTSRIHRAIGMGSDQLLDALSRELHRRAAPVTHVTSGTR
jgi:beta-phosphoglucomutase-like phosphatase (HAD superfamily)